MKEALTFEIDAISYNGLLSDLRQYGVQAKKAIKNAVNRTALAIETVAKKRLSGELGSDKHIVTGRLRASVHAELENNKSFTYRDDEGLTFDGSLNEPLGEMDAIAGTNVVYGPRIEIEQDAYLRYAAEVEDKRLSERIEEELNKL